SLHPPMERTQLLALAGTSCAIEALPDCRRVEESLDQVFGQPRLPPIGIDPSGTCAGRPDPERIALVWIAHDELTGKRSTALASRLRCAPVLRDTADMSAAIHIAVLHVDATGTQHGGDVGSELAPCGALGEHSVCTRIEQIHPHERIVELRHNDDGHEPPLLVLF